MLGAIIGDIAGSAYEFRNTKDYNFRMFTRNSNYTDDSIMTLAVAEWAMKEGKFSPKELEAIIVDFAKKYPFPCGGYGGGFRIWLFHPEDLRPYGEDRIGGRHPYGSWGNGSAMRASSIGWICNSLEEAERVAAISAAITHNHPEGIKGAQAVASSIFLARTGSSKEEIKEYVSRRYDYDLDRTWEFLHENYSWDSSCQGTVPEAIICFLTSHDFEDAIRRAVSIGGDSDTLACITGGIAEAFYKSIPSFMVEKALGLLTKDLKNVYSRFMNISSYRSVAKQYVNLNQPEYTPERIAHLEKDEIFVFGSNLHGRHGGGAAKAAYEKFGAEWGVGVGRTGRCYAIPTMQGGVETIKPYVDEFVRYAAAHPDLKFYVTRIGCGIAGFRDEEIAPLFKGCIVLPNVVLPKKFHEVILSGIRPQLPRYLREKIHGQTQTMVDLLIEMNKSKHFTDPDTALNELFEYLQHLRGDGDFVAFDCSIRSIHAFAGRCFTNKQLDTEKLEQSLHHDFYEGVDKVYENYVVEKTMILIEYLNDFRRYTCVDDLLSDLHEIGFSVNHCGPQREGYYFEFGSPWGYYPTIFMSMNLKYYWSELTVDGKLDNKLLYEKFVGEHERELKKLGIDRLIETHYEPDSACHPDVMVPKDGFVGPIYVVNKLIGENHSGNRVYRKSCGEGKGPNSIFDLWESRGLVKLLMKDEKYVFVPTDIHRNDPEHGEGYFFSMDDITLPVFYNNGFRVERLEFESDYAKRQFIEEHASPVR